MLKILVAALLVPATAPILTPPAVSTGLAPPERNLMSWQPGEIRCGGAPVTPVSLVRPLTSLTWESQNRVMSLTYAFAIDPDGRTTGIRKVEKYARADGSEDIAPSLAASRFAVGSGHPDCTIVYTPRQMSLKEAPVEDLTAYSVNAISGRLPQYAWERIYSGSDCQDERALGLKNRAFPNFQDVPATPGVRLWSMVGYDITKDGVTSNIRTVAGSGNARLDVASRRAVEDTRYYAGERKGCRYPYWRNPATLAAPPAPEESEFRPAGATCPARLDWVVRPNPRFPEPYRRRAIDGWAIVTYDVAPWGEIANIRVAASQPTEDFGDQAMLILRSTKVAANQGFVGCTERVKFAMSPTEENMQ